MTSHLVLIVLALPLLWPAAASAQPMTRAQAVEIALRNNPAVQRSAEEIARLEGAILEARADALPDLRLTATATRYRDPTFLNSPGFDEFPPELLSRLRPVAANLYEGSASVTQTLFSFKLGHAVTAARLGRDFAREDFARSRQIVALATVRAYNLLLFARENVRVADATVRQREEQLQVVENRRNAGVATELDVLRSQVALENARAALTRSRGQVELALGNLNAVMVRPIDAPVDQAESFADVPFPLSLDEVIAVAMAARPELRAAQFNERLRDELIGVARGDKRPTFDFTAAYGVSARDPSNLLDLDYSKWRAGVTVAWPLFDGFRTDGRVARAEAERRQASQDTIAIANQIRLEAKEAFDRLSVARGVLAASDLNVTQARRALEMIQANLQYGAATLLDVLDAQTALVVAELTRTQALYDQADAIATLQFVMGRDPASLP